MKKRINVTNGSFNTDLYALLGNLPEEILYHHDHNLRHPLGIYNVSVARVMNGFEGIIASINSANDYSGQEKVIKEAIKNLQNRIVSINDETEKRETENKIDSLKEELEFLSKQDDDEGKRILNSIKELLDAMMSFIDDSYHIFKCIYPSNSAKKNPLFADKWMESANKKLTSEYKEKIKEYREFLAPIVNKIKHNHARLFRVVFKTEHGRIEGYYVEGVDSKGSLGTDIEIHKKFRNQETAFSVNRDLKIHLINFVFICHHIKVYLQRMINDKHNRTIDTTNVTIGGDKRYLDIVKVVSELPNLYFPDEFFKPQPEISVNSEYIDFILPSNSANTLLYGDCEIKFQSTLDGVSRSLRLPYWIPRKGMK